MSLERFGKAWEAKFGEAPKRNVPLAPYTTIGIGGPADALVEAKTADQLIEALRLARQFDLPCTILGGGSNVLIRDAGIRGLVIVNRCKRIEVDGTIVKAESGAPFAGLARKTIRLGLRGLEWGVSIPGTVGGAVVGNAGAYGGDVASVLKRAEVLSPDIKRESWIRERFSFGYRTSYLKEAWKRGEKWLVLSVEFELKKGDKESLEAKAAEYLEHRRRTQPKEPSMGSTFKNPPGDYAGRLIDRAGLKGKRAGNAQISTVHANFIVNLGGATASEVEKLMEIARNEVFRQFGIDLEPEVLILGG